MGNDTMPVRRLQPADGNVVYDIIHFVMCFVTPDSDLVMGDDESGMRQSSRSSCP